MNNGTIEASFQELKQVPTQTRMVNKDEVLNETILVGVYRYKDEPLFDDDGEPFCDENGTQYVGRVAAGMRTAKIKNIVPVDSYHEALAVMDGFEGGMPNKEQIDHMTELVLQCWQISEPFMTKKMLREGVDGDRVMVLFTRFFNRENPPSNVSPSQEGNITPEVG
jgi:hypothetical protein